MAWNHRANSEVRRVFRRIGDFRGSFGRPLEGISGFALLAAVVMAANLVLGGGTRSGFLSDALLQLIALPLLLLSLWHLLNGRAERHMRWGLAFCCSLALVPVLQLLPLPPVVWTALPERDTLKASFELLGNDLPWWPLSMVPQATWQSAVALIPPIAIFLATLLMSYRERRLLSIVIITVGLVSIFLGLLQLAQGPASPLRFFTFTNPQDAVGFFANRNHYAALLYCAMLLAVAWTTTFIFEATHRRGGKALDTNTLIALIVTLTITVMFVAAQIMARSRAGLGLTIVALLGAYALSFSSGVSQDRSDGPEELSMGRTLSRRVMLVAVSLAVLFATQYALFRVFERFGKDPLADLRVLFAKNMLTAAQDFMPFGSGAGTFVPIYQLFERPVDLMRVYANRAHNDLLEWWLEAGVIGLALMAAFAIWFAVTTFKIWRRPPDDGERIDQALARAATLVVGLLVIHSLVDYPLRTAAMQAIAAFACALMIAPPPRALARATARSATWPRTSDVAASRPAPRPKTAPPARPTAPASAQSGGADEVAESGRAAARPSETKAEGAPPVTRKPRARWGEDMDWPEEWRQPTADGASAKADASSEAKDD